jgi:hypothetical protein
MWLEEFDQSQPSLFQKGVVLPQIQAPDFFAFAYS